MDPLLQDLRFALRGLARRPVFTLVAAVSLALGIGAGTAIFDVANALLIRSLPGIGEPDRVVEIGRTRDGRGFDTFSYPDFLDLRGLDPLADVSVWSPQPLSLSGEEGGERALGMLVSANYFQTMAVRPALGRAFRPDEDTGPGEHPVAVLSYRFWQRRFGGDPGAVGSTLQINRQPYTVIGVAPADFQGHTAGIQPDVWIPAMQYPALTGRNADFDERADNAWLAVGRLAPGASVEAADAAARTLFANLARAYPETNAHRGARVISLGPVPGAGRGAVSGFLVVLLALAGLVLLVTCANVAGMLLARSAAREKEIAMRLALGAGRGRLIRQLVTEALAIFALGGAAGAVVAVWGTVSISVASLPSPYPIHLDLSADWRVFAFALAVTLTTGLGFGLVPALQSTRPDLVPALKDQTGGSGRRKSRLRRAFVAAQVGMSLLLLVAAGLFLRSLQRAANVETGFDARGVYMTSLNLSLEGYRKEDRGEALLESVLAWVRAMPGVDAAALAADLPLDLSAFGTGVIPEGWEGNGGDDYVGVDFNVVSTGYFETLRIPLLRGRVFQPSDGPDAPRVAVVSRAFAERVWPGEDALGRRFVYGSRDGPTLTIVGVVADVKNQTITETPRPFVYTPVAQNYTGAVNVLARLRGATTGLSAVAGPLRRAILEADPSLSLTPVVSVADYTAVGILPQRLAAAIASALGGLALLLSALGVYGVVAYAVTGRTRELGVRVALGAERGDLLRLIVRDGLGLALPGLAAGAVLAVALGYAVRSLLLGVPPLDPATYVVTGALLLAVVLAASLGPAIRAARSDPMVALRHE